eukprot:4166537-Prymnesium_polylepis.2
MGGVRHVSRGFLQLPQNRKFVVVTLVVHWNLAAGGLERRHLLLAVARPRVRTQSALGLVCWGAAAL